MFDKLKKKNKNPSADEFFKNEEEVEETEESEEINENEVETEELLTKDLEAFKDDLKKTKPAAAIDDEDEEEEPLPASVDEEVVQEERKKKETKEPSANPSAKKQWLRRQSDNDESGDWLNKDYEEGELAVDVYQDKNNIYIKSTIAGVSPDDIDISIHDDMLTIRGKREKSDEECNVDYFYQECYWGSFSRSIILPVEVRADKIDAFIKEGVLTIVLPKIKVSKSAKVKVKEK